MRKSTHIDDAFKSIKTATGVNDVQELVSKFLTREQTYSQLLMAVSDSERKIDELKRENEELRGRLHDLNIASEGAGGKGTTSEEILELEEQLEQIKRDDAIIGEKFANVQIVNDQIEGWAKRVVLKVDETMNKEKAEHMDMVDVFEQVANIVVENLEKLIE